MQESNFNVIIDSENYTAVIGENAKIDVGQAISNVKSGKAEIEAAVQDGKAAFNLNAAAKTQEFDDHVVDSLNEAKQWAIGEPEEPTGNSAKYWAEQAASSVTGLGARVTAIEGKIPADASSSNQLADKNWVGNQGYITGITSGDVTTALGYTPYDASNPNGYTSNVGTVTSVNNTSPDGSGNVTITIPNPLPSQSGQSGKFLTTDGTDASWAAVPTRNIGEIVQSTIPLTDAGLHLLDGSLLQGSGAYGDFTTYIAGLVSTYPDLFETEANWQQSVTDYGVCGKFVYDNINNTVRLPKITGFTEGTIDATVLGDLVEAGLPNITGTYVYSSPEWITSNSGALQASSTTYSNRNSTNGNGSIITLSLDASRSSSIYGNSNTVQPQAIKVLYYIVIATSTKTSIEVDIDEIATDLNGKADVDLTNVTTSGKSLISGLSMPSNRYTDLTLGASGTEYTAPANGWFAVSKTSGATGKYLGLLNATSDIGVETYPNANTNNAKLIIPIKKNDVLRVTYSLTGATNYFKFIYAEGEPNV